MGGLPPQARFQLHLGDDAGPLSLQPHLLKQSLAELAQRIDWNKHFFAGCLPRRAGHQRLGRSRPRFEGSRLRGAPAGIGK